MNSPRRGKASLDHARLALIQVEADGEAARRAAKPSKATFAIGFLTGQEIDWLPEVMRVLRDELPNIDVTVSSQYSPDLAHALMRGKLDLAFLRPEAKTADLIYRVVTRELLVVILPSDHRLGSRDVIDPREIATETLLSVSHTAPALRTVIDDYLKRTGIDTGRDHRCIGQFAADLRVPARADDITSSISRVRRTAW